MEMPVGDHLDCVNCRSGWSVEMPVVDHLTMLTDLGRPSLKVGSTIPLS